MARKKLTPMQAIKAYCRYQCCNNDLISWKQCTAEKICPLHAYRTGRRPKTKPFAEYCKKPIVLPEKDTKKANSQGVSK